MSCTDLVSGILQKYGWPKEIISLLWIYVIPIRYVSISKSKSNLYLASDNHIAIPKSLIGSSDMNNNSFGTWSNTSLLHGPQKWEIRIKQTKHISRLCIGLAFTDPTFAISEFDFIAWSAIRSLMYHTAESPWGVQTGTYGLHFSENPYAKCKACVQHLHDDDVFTLERHYECGKLAGIIIVRNHCEKDSCRIFVPSYPSYGVEDGMVPYVGVTLTGPFSFSFSTCMF
jgi:hypothetical protein